MRFILLGCPGAGKGTQAKLIATQYHIPQISTGDILRAAIREGSTLGQEVKERVDNGQLIPDDVMSKLVFDRIRQTDCQHGFLLDGFPRTVSQAEALQQQTVIDCIIEIEVPEGEVIKRLSGRRIHLASGRTYHVIYQPPQREGQDDVTGEPLVQRPDDSEEIIRQRLLTYQVQADLLRNYYQQLSLYSREPLPHYEVVNGTGSVKEISDKIFSILSRYA
jgi:adenylate kinase